MRSTTIGVKKKQEKGAWVYLPGHGLNDELCLTLVASVGSEAAFKSSSSIE